MPKPSSTNNPFRIQGTDGIRREVRLASDPALKGLTPQQAFLERGVITDLFMEQYACAHVQTVLAGRRSKTRAVFVVGWDPRDVSGKFNEAVVRGIRKAGADAHVLGLVPTPLVPLYIQYANADGGFMVTASHNPKDQNGIKIFLAHRGMKLLPDNDVALTEALLAMPSLKSKPLTGTRQDRHDAALDLFLKFSLDPENSWIDAAQSRRHITVVVDPAHGALTGLAARVFRDAGFGKVIEVNNRLDGNVNLNSGVADLEGHRVIAAEEIDPKSGAFRKHKAVGTLFKLGRRHRDALRNGTRRVAGAVFDADGDRFYRLDYHPSKDCLLVSSGDETAYLQAAYLIAHDPAAYRNAAYIHTVESDLNTGLAAEALGLQRQLCAVGDKWILYRIAGMIAAARLKSVKGAAKTALTKKLKTLQKNGRGDVAELATLEAGIDRITPHAAAQPFTLPLAVGSEETGHNITQGWLDTEAGARIPVFAGNGLKSALNTFAATEALLGAHSVKRYYTSLEKPYPPGFKATLYAYYVKQHDFFRDAAAWKRVLGLLRKGAKARGFTCKTLRFAEDPDMLYVSLTSAKGREAAVFVRNSGTENKIGVNLRGAKQDATALKALGESTIRLLLQTLKDSAHPLHAIERDLLTRMAVKPVTASALHEGDAPRKGDAPGEDGTSRVLREMGKQQLVRLTAKGFVLTPRGKWYIGL